MKVIKTLKGDSFLLETNCHTIEIFPCMAKDASTFKGGSWHTEDIDHTVKNMPLIGGLCHAADFDQI